MNILPKINMTFTSYNSAKKYAIMLTYNHIPDTQTLSYITESVDMLLLVDNNSRNDVQREIKRICNNMKKCTLICNSVNLGISKAYNVAAEIAQRDGAEFIIFFDHDAVISSNLFDEYSRAAMTLCDRLYPIGIIVPIVSDDKELLNKKIFARKEYTIVSYPINSGMLVSMKTFKEIGGYEELFFVELADFYFSARVRKNGYKIVRINKVLIVQEFEKKLDHTDILTAFFDRVIRLRSIVRVGISNSNIFRTRLSLYSKNREQELSASLNIAQLKLPTDRKFLTIVKFLNFIEKIITDLLS